MDLSDGADKLVKHIIRPGNGELIPLDCKAIVHYIGRFEVCIDASIRLPV